MASVLQTIVEKKHYAFVDKLDSWQQGVELSAKSLVALLFLSTNCTLNVDCIEKYGPYVVFDHYVAMPHSQENAQGVHKTGIGFMRVKEPVSFGKDEDGEEKLAKLFFTLAACNPDEHLNNIQQLASLFCNEELLDALMAANTPEDILAAEAAHPIEEM